MAAAAELVMRVCALTFKMYTSDTLEGEKQENSPVERLLEVSLLDLLVQVAHVDRVADHPDIRHDADISSKGPSPLSICLSHARREPHKRNPPPQTKAPSPSTTLRRSESVARL